MDELPYHIADKEKIHNERVLNRIIENSYDDLMSGLMIALGIYQEERKE
jgi:hypothetical protein